MVVSFTLLSHLLQGKSSFYILDECVTDHSGFSDEKSAEVSVFHCFVSQK